MHGSSLLLSTIFTLFFCVGFLKLRKVETVSLSKNPNIKRWLSPSGACGCGHVGVGVSRGRDQFVATNWYHTLAACSALGSSAAFFPLLRRCCATNEGNVRFFFFSTRRWFISWSVRGREGACGCGRVGTGVSWRRCRCDHVLAGESCFVARRIGMEEACTASAPSVCSSGVEIRSRPAPSREAIGPQDPDESFSTRSWFFSPFCSCLVDRALTESGNTAALTTPLKVEEARVP